MTKTKAEKNKLISYKNLLIKNIKIEVSNNSYNLYTKLRDLYAVGKRINPKYTKVNMAEELDMSYQKVYIYLLFSKSNENTIRMVRNHEISFFKVIKYFAAYGKGSENYQDENLQMIIKNNWTAEEIEKAFLKCNQEQSETAVTIIREYRNVSNIERDVRVYVSKFQKLLPNVNKIPEAKREAVLRNLLILKKHLEAAVKKLR